MTIPPSHLSTTGRSYPYQRPHPSVRFSGDRIFKILRSPRIDARESITTGRCDNPIPTRFLAPKDCLKIPAQAKAGRIVFFGIDSWAPWNIKMQSQLDCTKECIDFNYFYEETENAEPVMAGNIKSKIHLKTTILIFFHYANCSTSRIIFMYALYKSTFSKIILFLSSKEVYSSMPLFLFIYRYRQY